MSAEAHPLLEFDRHVELHAVGAEGRDRLLVPVPDLGAATDVVVEREVAWVGGGAGADVQVLLAIAAALDVAHADDVAGVAVGGVAVRCAATGNDRETGDVAEGGAGRCDDGCHGRGNEARPELCRVHGSRIGCVTHAFNRQQRSREKPVESNPRHAGHRVRAVPYDWRTEYPGIFARHADSCPVRSGGADTCGPLGYRASVRDPHTGRRSLSPELPTMNDARAWLYDQQVALD